MKFNCFVYIYFFCKIEINHEVFHPPYKYKSTSLLTTTILNPLFISLLVLPLVALVACTEYQGSVICLIEKGTI